MSALFALSVYTTDSNHQIHHFYQLYIYWTEVIISSLDSWMSILTCMRQMSSLQHPVTYSHPLSRGSQFCLYYEWMASSILAGVLGSNQWSLAPAEITGVTGGWAHEFSNAGSVNAFVRFLQHQICCRMYQGLTEWSLFFMGFLVAILFAWPANDSSLPQTYRKW